MNTAQTVNGPKTDLFAQYVALRGGKSGIPRLRGDTDLKVAQRQLLAAGIKVSFDELQDAFKQAESHNYGYLDTRDNKCVFKWSISPVRVLQLLRSEKGTRLMVERRAESKHAIVLKKGDVTIETDSVETAANLLKFI